MANQQFPLSYVDFLPACLQQGGLMTLPQFERFGVLMQRANDWLVANPHMKVMTVESLELLCRQMPTTYNNEISIYMENRVNNSYVRVLRLWIASKGPQDRPEPVRLGYYNVVPACIRSGGLLSMPEFERFDTTLNKVNEMFRSQPLQGRIINIETQDILFEAWGNGVDPDNSYWFEREKVNTCFLNILRIFYQAGPPAMESIGCVDMVPVVSGNGMSIQGEPFGVITQRANQWVTEHPGVRVTNLQSINYKMDLSLFSHQTQGPDTMRSLFYKSGRATTVFCRIVRVCFVSSAETQMGPPPPQITYKSFLPFCVRPNSSALMYNPKFELMSQNMGRLAAWLKYTGARVIGMETQRIIVRYNALDPDNTITFDGGREQNVWLYMFRLYLDGHYAEPPPEALPPPPPQEAPLNTGCCAVM